MASNPIRRALAAGLGAGLLIGAAAGAIVACVLLRAPGVLRPAGAPDWAPALTVGAVVAALVAWAGALSSPLWLLVRSPGPTALAWVGVATLALPSALILNVRYLPELRSPASVTGNSILLGLTLALGSLLAWLFSRRFGEREAPRLGFRLTALVALSLLTVVLSAGESRDLPPESPRSEPAPERRAQLLLLITIDALRADHLGAYGSKLETSPVIDSLAASGTLYEQCFAQAPNTHPSLASMMLGQPLTAFDHLAVKDFLPPGAETLALRARRLGYRTLAVVSNPWLNREMGFDQGFDRFDDETAMVADAERVTDAGLALIEAESGDLFVWLHYLDPHHPYTPPVPYDLRFGSADAEADAVQRRPDMNAFLIAAAKGEAALGAGAWARLEQLYDGEILFADSEIGRLLQRLAELGRMNDARIVVTADHGEEFRDHGGVLHAHSLYSELVRLPLVVWDSQALRPGGGREAELIAATEIGNLLLGFEPRRADSVLSEKLQETERLTPPLVALRTREATLIVPAFRPALVGSSPRRLAWSLRELALFLPRAMDAELYRGEDRREQQEIARSAPALRAEMESKLRAAYRQQKAAHRGSAELPAEGTLEKLRGLGYLQP